MTTATPSHADPRIGIWLTVAAIGIFGVQDTFAKVLVQDYAVAQVVMVRYWAFAAFSVWLAMRQGGLMAALKAKRPGQQVLRGLLLIADVILFALAVRTMPLGELHAILLVFPILVTVFSIPILGEKVGPFRWAAVVAGFVGTLIILRPGMAVFGEGALYGLGAAGAFSLYVVFTRKTAHEDSTATAMVYVALTGMVVSTVPGIFAWQPLTLQAWGMIAGMWVTTSLGHYLVMRSLHHAPASVVQPFNYLMLPWAITLSFVVFGHVIDFVSLIGAGVVVAAGLTVMWRERVRREHYEVPLLHGAAVEMEAEKDDTAR